MKMQLQDIVDFCEGRLNGEEFGKALLEPGTEALFEDSPPIPPYTQSHAHGMVYYYLIEQDYKNIDNLLDIQDCLSQLLQKKGIGVARGNQMDKLHSIAMDAQPAWLNAPGSYVSTLLKVLSGTDKEKRIALKKLLLEKFRYMNKPPRWPHQSPALWPVVDNEPLLFVGQMDVTPLSHDLAQLYIFFDERDGSFKNIVQNR